MTPFKKYVNGNLYTASPLYDGYYDNDKFIMLFKDDYWFKLEILNIEMLSNKSYAPKVLTIDKENKKIIINWKNCNNINHLLNFNQPLPKDWKEQIKYILLDLENSDMYKINLYPHTFYVDHTTVRIIDLYGCLRKNVPIYQDDIDYILNDKDRFKFNNGILNIKETYDYTLKNNIGNWPEGIIDA
jgi:hypothetical protein